MTVLACTTVVALVWGFFATSTVFDASLALVAVALRIADAVFYAAAALAGAAAALACLPRRLWALVSRQQHAAHAPRRPRVAIVGASFAGLEAEKRLASSGRVDVTLIDYKDYFEYTPGVLRCFVDPGYIARITCPLTPTGPGGSTRLVAELTAINPGLESVTLSLTPAGAPPMEATYDHVILAVGSSYPGVIKPRPLTPTAASRAAAWRAAAAGVAAAGGVKIVGGGPVGVELAAEFAESRGVRDSVSARVIVTLVTAAATLMDAGLPAAAGAAAKRWLESAGVRVITGVSQGPDDHGLDHGLGPGLGHGLEYVITCYGGAAATAPLRGGKLESSLDGRGRLRVGPTLQVPGAPRVFGVGDAMVHDSAEVKLGLTAELNAHLAATNVLRLLAGVPLLTYPEGLAGSGRRSPRIYCVSLGKRCAILCFNGVTVVGRVPALLKCVMEMTKTQAAAGRPAAAAFWVLADAAALLANRIYPGSD